MFVCVFGGICLDIYRLFGIEARASAGQTTQGINCCQLDIMEDRQLIVIDTEGIASVEKAEKNQKRDRKIMLGSLAPSRVFLLNIMKDASDVRVLDVILWAYNKLNLSPNVAPSRPRTPSENLSSLRAVMPMNEANSFTSNSKQLSDIKFIFVIRDCQELADLEWLEIQKNQINKLLTESLKSAIENDAAGLKYKGIASIDDVIGEAEYFPMPPAFGEV